ncbi:MAG: glycosyltransferase family 2 protein [Nitrospinae bacterium]|nr:glycosyltransferase family 2 protein [Nitrospinota bacterium]
MSNLQKFSLSIILPAYNEAGNIPEVLKKIQKVFLTMSLNGEVLIINDGSTDNTGQVAEGFREKYPFLHVLHHRKNMGLTESLMTGFENVKGDVIIFLCSDLESDPEEDIPKLLSGIEDGYDMVVGWRENRGDGKLMTSKIYNLLSRILFGVTLHDQNWIKAFKRDVVSALPLRSNWHRFIVPLAYHEGYKIKEVRTNWYPRKYGASKYGIGRLFSAVIDLIVIKFRLSFIKRPMFFFGSIGISLFLIGFFINLLQVIGDFFFHYEIKEHVPMLILGIASMILGFQLISIGLLGELVVDYTSKQDRKKRL